MPVEQGVRTGGPSSSPKRHHYVPRAYLERWSQEGRVAVRPRIGEGFWSNAINVAVQTGFYTLTGDDGRPTTALEEWLARADDDLIRVLREIDGHHRPPPAGSDEQGVVAVAMALQLARTPASRARIEFPVLVHDYAAGRPITVELVTEYLERVHLRFTPSANEAGAAFDFVSYALRELHQFSREFVVDLSFSSVAAIAPVLLRRSWSMEFDERGQFLTSDRPITAWRPPSPEDGYRGYGFENAREIRYPTSPTTQLVLTRRPRPAPRVNVLKRRVAHCNGVVAEMCDRFVVGQPSNQLLHSVELLTRGPVMRFASGPLVGTVNGVEVEDGEILHMYEDRRQQ